MNLILQVAVALNTAAMPCPSTTEWRGNCEVLSEAQRLEIFEITAAATDTMQEECLRALDALKQTLLAPSWKPVWKFEYHKRDTPSSFVGAETIRLIPGDPFRLGFSARSLKEGTRTTAHVALHEGAHMISSPGDEAYAKELENKCIK